MAHGWREDSEESFDGINIVPFVDIVLVLLVIFMITAPMMVRQTMDLQLPKAKTSDARMQQTLGIVISRLGQITINGDLVAQSALDVSIARVVAGNEEIQAVISADLEVSHGIVVSVIDAVRSAGVTKFALEVERKK